MYFTRCVYVLYLLCVCILPAVCMLAGCYVDTELTIGVSGSGEAFGLRRTSHQDGQQAGHPLLETHESGQSRSDKWYASIVTLQSLAEPILVY